MTPTRSRAGRASVMQRSLWRRPATLGSGRDWRTSGARRVEFGRRTVARPRPGTAARTAHGPGRVVRGGDHGDRTRPATVPARTRLAVAPRRAGLRRVPARRPD